MIELKLKTGEELILTPIKNDSGVYELVDNANIIRMTLELVDSIFHILDMKDIDEGNDDLREKLDLLVLKVIEAEQSGVSNNENDTECNISPYNPDQIRVHQKQFSIKFIQEMIDNEDIDFNPDFQRNFVWTSVQKSRLIESLLLRIPLPIFYFAEDEDGRLTIVDGLQRLTTIKQFMNNEFPIRHLEYLDEGVKGRYYKTNAEKNQKGIDPKYYRWFNMTQFSVNVIDPASPFKVKYDIFRRINTGGKTLNNQEIRNCLAQEPLRVLLRNMKDSKYFIAATDNSVKSTRMQDQEMALRFLMFYKYFKQDPSLDDVYQGNMESSLDATTESLSNISNEYSKELLGLFENAMKNAVHLFGEKYSFRKIDDKDLEEDARKQPINKALFVVWTVLLADISNDKLVKKYNKYYMLAHFMHLLKYDKDLLFFLSYGTNGKANLQYVFKTISKLIKETIEQ